MVGSGVEDSLSNLNVSHFRECVSGGLSLDELMERKGKDDKLTSYLIVKGGSEG
jgi:hypothetical protein